MTDISLREELKKLQDSLMETVKPEERKAARAHMFLGSIFFPNAIHLPADPCLRVVTQFMEGVDDA